MNACKSNLDSPRLPNFSGSPSSNRENDSRSDQAMSALSVAMEKRFTTCPVTDTSGTIVRRRDIAGFSLSEAVYPQGLVLSRHCHSNAYLSFILSGSYTEKYLDRGCVCAEGALRFLPPGQLHEN